jgi:tRNA (guanine-N7-)-methyltransferase
MARQKLVRQEKLTEFDNVLEASEELKGNWSKHFKNDNPIILEIACGKAEFSCGYAQMYPDRNIIGLDKKSDRIFVGAKFALDNDLPNVAFCRCLIDNLDDYFEEKEVDEIWITFPDPHPKKTKKNKRLTWPRFLALYKTVLKPGGIVHLKTDAEALHDWTLEIIEQEGHELITAQKDIYADNKLPEHLKIKTTFERKHLALSKKINYCSFRLK